MNNQFLNREGAPLESKTWEALDATMAGAARSRLSARRLIAVEGPFGLGLKAIPLGDTVLVSGLVTAGSLPVQFIHKRFRLTARDIAAFEHDGVSLDERPVATAAIECAAAEDDLVFYGAGELPGLLNTDRACKTTLTAWAKPGDAAADIIRAITSLDAAGFHGPYALALEPARRNLLLRRYPDGNGTELEHLKQMVTGGVHKAPGLKGGAVLLATGAQFCTMVLGQDMSVGFIGPVEQSLEFSVSESLALHVREPRSVCVLTE